MGLKQPRFDVCVFWWVRAGSNIAALGPRRLVEKPLPDAENAPSRGFAPVPHQVPIFKGLGGGSLVCRGHHSVGGNLVPHRRWLGGHRLLVYRQCKSHAILFPTILAANIKYLGPS